MASVPRDLNTLLVARAEESPGRVAYRYLGATAGPRVVSYGALHETAAKVATVLHDEGAPGQRALLLFPPGLEFIQAFFGCVGAGAIAVPAPTPNPLKPKRSLQRIASIVASAKPTWALTTTQVLRALEPALAEMPAFADVRWICVDRLPEQHEPRPIEAADPSSVAMIQYTSGSTSDPKGAALTHGNLIDNLAYFDVGWDHSPETILVNWLPAFHDLGLVYGILAPLWGRFTSIQMSPIDVVTKPLSWLRAISTHRATHSCGPNFIYELCVRKVREEELATLDLSSWKVALTAAEPVRAETMARFTRRFGPVGFSSRTFCPGYGLSEGTCKVTALAWDEEPTVLRLRSDRLERHEVALAQPGAPALKVVGCGRPGYGVRVSIVDPATRRPLGPGHVGEVWVSGGGIAQSYWERPEATEELLRARIEGGDGTPHLRTGDLGFLHDEQVFITGRIKDMIIVRGANHYPQDIEYTVQDSHQSVRAGCVAAFSLDEGGEELLGVVAEVERRERDSRPLMGDRRVEDPMPPLPPAPVPFSAAEVTSAVRKAVAETHGLRVHRVALIKAGTIPKTTSGKIQRGACKRLLLEGRMDILIDAIEVDDQPTSLRDYVRARVTDIICEIGTIPMDLIDPSVSLHTFGVDSLAGANIAYEIGLLTGHDVPSELLDERDTVDKIVDYVVRLGGLR